MQAVQDKAKAKKKRKGEGEDELLSDAESEDSGAAGERSKRSMWGWCAVQCTGRCWLAGGCRCCGVGNCWQPSDASSSTC